jgi:hypothetical protein
MHPGKDGHGGAMKTDGETTTGVVMDIKGCRVQHIGLDGYAECLDVGPKACPYALPFGYAFLCKHPRLEAIIERTQQEKAKRAASN